MILENREVSGKKSLLKWIKGEWRRKGWKLRSCRIRLGRRKL